MFGPKEKERGRKSKKKKRKEKKKKENTKGKNYVSCFIIFYLKLVGFVLNENGNPKKRKPEKTHLELLHSAEGSICTVPRPKASNLLSYLNL